MTMPVWSREDPSCQRTEESVPEGSRSYTLMSISVLEDVRDKLERWLGFLEGAWGIFGF